MANWGWDCMGLSRIGRIDDGPQQLTGPGEVPLME
jgi:hypothetical protein